MHGPCTALHCTALHCTALHCTALHCTALHCPRPCITARRSATLIYGHQSTRAAHCIILTVKSVQWALPVLHFTLRCTVCNVHSWYKLLHGRVCMLANTNRTQFSVGLIPSFAACWGRVETFPGCVASELNIAFPSGEVGIAGDSELIALNPDTSNKETTSSWGA
jgi:hypothetical protein